MLRSNTWKQIYSGSFKIRTYRLFKNYVFNLDIFKQNLAKGWYAVKTNRQNISNFQDFETFTKENLDNIEVTVLKKKNVESLMKETTYATVARNIQRQQATRQFWFTTSK